jgi:hypothetical protein
VDDELIYYNYIINVIVARKVDAGRGEKGSYSLSIRKRPTVQLGCSGKGNVMTCDVYWADCFPL